MFWFLDPTSRLPPTINSSHRNPNVSEIRASPTIHCGNPELVDCFICYPSSQVTEDMRWWWLAILVRSVAAEHPSLMAPVAAISSHVCRQPVYIDPVHKVLPKKSMDRGRRRKNLTQIASVRGGAGLLESGPMAAISSSKTLSWIVLVTSIGVETIGTSLSKQARESENLTLFVVSLSLYLTR